MDIYILYINEHKYKKYKTEKEALDDIVSVKEENVKNNLRIYIKLIHEEYCDYGYSDSKCKIDIIYKETI